MNNDTMPLKRCNKCFELKPATHEHFNRDKSTKDGLQRSCKKCQAEYRDANRERCRTLSRRYYSEHRERLKGNNRQYWRQNKERLDVYHREYREKHRERISKRNHEYQREYYLKNRERILTRTRKHYQANSVRICKRIKHYLQRKPFMRRIFEQRRRALKLSLPHTFTHEDWLSCLNYFEYRCAVCGRPSGELHYLAQDHWIPLDDKRPNNPGTVAKNMIPLCHSKKGGKDGCNSQKLNKDAKAWLIQRYGEDKATEVLKRIQDYFDSL